MLLVSLTLLPLIANRNEISSLADAVCPGVLPVLIVVPQDKFVALYKQETFALCVRTLSKETGGKARGDNVNTGWIQENVRI